MLNYQQLSLPKITPAPSGVKLNIKEYVSENEEEEATDAECPVILYPSFPNEEEITRYEWQYKPVEDGERFWRFMDKANEEEFTVDLSEIMDENGFPLFDYRLMYETEDGVFCTPSLFTNSVFDPSAYAESEVPKDTDISTPKDYKEYKATKDFEDFEFQVSFAEGEKVKFIKVTALNNSEYELDEMGLFTIYECIGGEVSDICNTFTVTVKDDDNSDIKESTISFNETEHTVKEGEDTVKLGIKREGDLRYLTTVKYTAKSNTAISGKHFVETTGEIMLGPDTNTGNIEIPLISGGENGKDIDFTVELSEVLGGNGKCTVNEKKGTAKVIIPFGTVKSVKIEGGVVGSGNNLSSVLCSSEGTDNSKKLVESTESLTYENEEGIEVTEAEHASPIYADFGTSNNLGTYDYTAVKLRRGEKYNENCFYWKDTEIPYYTDKKFAVNDSVNYILSGAEFRDKGNLSAKSAGKGLLSSNYDTTKAATLNIANAGFMFSKVKYRFDVKNVAVVGQFLNIGWNYTMPWLNVKVGNDNDFCDFNPQSEKKKPLSMNSFEKEKDISFAKNDFHIDMNTTLNDSGQRKTTPQKFIYVPKTQTQLQLSNLEFNRRVFSNSEDIALRIYTANDGDSEFAKLNDNVYQSLRPEISLVERAAGVNTDGDLYVGSQICVKLGYSASYSGYDNGKTPSDSVFVTKTDGTYVPAKIERKDNQTYYVTLLWDNMTEADLQSKFRINVVYERRQDINFNITPSLERDSSGNALSDKENLQKSWNKVFNKNGGAMATLTCSKYTKDENKAKNRFETVTIKKPLKELFNDISKPTGLIAQKKSGITNIQKINFGLGKNDVILFNGEQYAGNETIELRADEITTAVLNFTFYDETHLNDDSIMTISISHKEIYLDGNANGKIDGYYDQSSGLFILDKKSGDEFLGATIDEIPEEFIQPTVNAEGKVKQYFFKVYYTITPRALHSGDKTAQILPCFVPQDTDKKALSQLTNEQKSYRMINAGGTIVQPYNKKTDKIGEKYKVDDTSEGHAMYGPAATKQSTLDIPLGGDVRAYKKVTINDKETILNIPDFAGNLKFNFDKPTTIMVKNSNGQSEGITETNGYLGSFLNKTTFVCGVQETRKLNSQNDFKAESIANGICYVRPTNNVAPTLGSTSEGTVGSNIGGGGHDVKAMGDFNSSMNLPTASFGAFGLSLQFVNVNQMMLSFGLPVYSYTKDFSSMRSVKTEKDKGDKKEVEEKKEDDKSTVKTKTVKDKKTGKTESEETEIKEKPKSYSDGNTSYDEEKIITDKKNPDGSKERTIENKRTNIVKDGEKQPDVISKSKEKVNPADDFEIINDSFAKEQNQKEKGGFKNYAKNVLSGAFDLDGFLKYLNNKDNPIGEASKLNPVSTEKIFQFTVSIKGYAVFEYNLINGGWNISSASATASALVSFSFKHRWLACPILYGFINISLNPEFNADWSFERTYKATGDITPTSGKKDTYMLKSGESLEFELTFSENCSGFRPTFKGSLNVEVFKDKEKTKRCLNGSLVSDITQSTDVKLRKYAKTVYVRLTATEDTEITGLAYTASKLESFFDGATQYTEFNFDIGVGVGIEILKAEVFANANAKGTFRILDEWYVKEFKLHGSVSFRIKLIFFNFSMDLVGVTYTGSRVDKDSEMEYKTYFEYFGHKRPLNGESNEDEYGITTELPESCADTQSFYGAYNEETGENAYHPTDKNVKFELSGYSGTGNAFKLADHLNTGNSYKAIDINGSTYVLYTISNPDVKDNGINASQLVLSKIEPIGKNPGILNPITEKPEDVPYIVVDPAATPETAVGDVSFAYSVEGSKLNIMYSQYNRHFTKEEKPSASETGKNLIVKTTSIDFADKEKAKFTTPKRVSDAEGAYRFAPTMDGNTAFYAETASNNANSARNDNLRAYLKAVYDINDEDYTAKTKDASKVQHIYRYTTQKEMKDLTGDGSRIIAVTPDGKQHIAEVGNNNGEVVTEMTTKNIDGKTVLFYLTDQDAYFNLEGKSLKKEEFDKDTDYAQITRLYCRVFDGEKWEQAKILRQIVNFERCSSSSSSNYPLRDGIYINGSLAESVIDPTLSNIRFLDADLDGKGIKPVMIFEMNNNTYLLDNAALTSIIGNGSASVKPLFSSNSGSGVTIAADKNGNMIMAYIKVMDSTENNAIYSAVWDKQLGKWGKGNIFAMGHMSVYENILKYGLTEEQAKKAYYGEVTGNKEYDAYAAKEGSEKGSADRFVFRSLQLLPSTTVKKFSDGTTETEDQLILVTDGIFSTLQKESGQLDGEPFECYTERESSGLGLYAIAFGAGEQQIGKANISFDKKEFFCGYSLTGKAEFTNTGSAAIRGSADQPVNVKLVAINDDGFTQVLAEKLVNGSIPSGETVSFDFTTVPLSKDLPEGTELRLFVSEDEEYITLSGGVPFSQITEPLYTVRNGSELMMDSMSYKMIFADDEFVYLGTDFVVSNRGNQKADNLFVQFSSVESNDKQTSKEIPLDLRGSILRVSNEEKITNDNSSEADLEHGKFKLVDNDGQTHLSPGYMRSVSGMLKIKRAEFSKLKQNGLNIKCVLYSDADSYNEDLESNLLTKNDTLEPIETNNTVTMFVPHQTDFNVPNNIVMNLNNTLRIPVSYTSTQTENDIIVREISNGTETWTPVFNDIHYDSNNVIVAVAKHTGQTVIQIEDRKTSSFREIVLDVRNGGFGINIFKDDDTFKFYNEDGSDGKGNVVTSEWEFRSNTPTWPGEDKSPMANDYCFMKKQGAYVTFETVATTIDIYYSGNIKVTSSAFPGKEFTGENSGKKNAPLRVRFDNLDAKHHTVKITAASGGTSLDRFTATYSEDMGTIKKSDKTAPSFYWERSFPNTASLKKSNHMEIGCYIVDESGVESLTLNGVEIDGLTKKSDRVYYFKYNFTENGQYNFVATDIDGNKTTHSFAVFWFNDILNEDAISSAPPFHDGFIDLINSKREVLKKDERTEDVYIANSYDFAKSNGDRLSVYTSINQDIDLSGKGITVNDIPPSERSYQKITEKLARNGFYISRVVSENGTWRQVLQEITQVKTEKTRVSVRPNPEKLYLDIEVDSSKSGLLAQSVKVNGYKLKPLMEEKSVYRFDITCRGDYTVEVFDGLDTIKLDEIRIDDDVEIEIKPGFYTIKRLSEDYFMVSLDPNKVIGAFYDVDKSNPSENKYVPFFRTAILEGDKRNELKEPGVIWNRDLDLLVPKSGYYSVGVNSYERYSSQYICVDDTPKQGGTVSINGDPQRGNTLEAKYSEPGLVLYQWFRKDKNGNETDIKGAEKSTYTVTPDDYFYYLGCRVSFNHEWGTVSGVSSKRAVAKPVAFSGSYDGKEHSLVNLDTGRDDVILVRNINNLDQKFDSYKDAGTYTFEYYMINKNMSPEEIRDRQYRGDYVSSSVEMKIDKFDIKDAEIELEKYTYDGKPHNPKVKSLKIGDFNISDENYKITGGDFNKIKSDMYFAEISGVGKNLCGSIRKTWWIYRRDINDHNTSIDYVKKFIADGKTHDFKVKSFTCDGMPITDYEVKGQKSACEPGKYQVDVFAYGDFTGNVSCDWEIVKKTNEVKIGNNIVVFDNLVYNGEEQICIPRIYYGDKEITDFTVTGNKATEVGEYEMTITFGSDKQTTYKVKWYIAEAGNEGDSEGEQQTKSQTSQQQTAKPTTPTNPSETVTSSSAETISESSINSNPSTGYTENMIVWFGILLASSAVCIVCLICSKKRKSKTRK